MNAITPTVTLYGKPGCCLCDEAREELDRLGRKVPFDLEEVDVSLDPALHREYGERMPVIAVDGEEVVELRIDAAARERLLARVAGS
ncbi:MAG: glutaredoxin family protein [Thermoleophilaceae bacterium]